MTKFVTNLNKLSAEKIAISISSMSEMVKLSNILPNPIYIYLLRIYLKRLGVTLISSEERRVGKESYILYTPYLQFVYKICRLTLIVCILYFLFIFCFFFLFIFF